MYDISSWESFLRTRETFRTLVEVKKSRLGTRKDGEGHGADVTVPAVLLGCVNDDGAVARREVAVLEGKALAAEFGSRFVEVMAGQRAGTMEVFQDLVRTIKRHDEFAKQRRMGIHSRYDSVASEYSKQYFEQPDGRINVEPDYTAERIHPEPRGWSTDTDSGHTSEQAETDQFSDDVGDESDHMKGFLDETDIWTQHTFDGTDLEHFEYVVESEPENAWRLGHGIDIEALHAMEQLDLEQPAHDMDLTPDCQITQARDSNIESRSVVKRTPSDPAGSSNSIEVQLLRPDVYVESEVIPEVTVTAFEDFILPQFTYRPPTRTPQPDTAERADSERFTIDSDISSEQWWWESEYCGSRIDDDPEYDWTEPDHPRRGITNYPDDTAKWKQPKPLERSNDIGPEYAIEPDAMDEVPNHNNVTSYPVFAWDRPKRPRSENDFKLEHRKTICRRVSEEYLRLSLLFALEHCFEKVVPESSDGPF